MIVKLLTEYQLEFLSLQGGCRGSSESTHVKMPHCWKSHALAQMMLVMLIKMIDKIKRRKTRWRCGKIAMADGFIMTMMPCEGDAEEDS